MKDYVREIVSIAKSRLTVRIFSLLIIWGTVLLTIVYTDFVERVTDDADNQHGVRAAIFALSAASTLFVRMVPKGFSKGDQAVDLLATLTIAGTTFAAAVFWLISESDSSPLYVLVLLPFIFVMFITMSCADDSARKK